MGCGSSVPVQDQSNNDQQQQSSAAVAAKKKKSPSERYDTIKLLGEGASCHVLAVKDRRSGKMFAMKVMTKKESFNQLLWENEKMILSKLQHPNILEFVEADEDIQNLYLLTVLCTGGELFDRVKNGSFSEKVASILAKQMLLALHHCHSHDVVHRDLKPENFVFEEDTQSSPMKLIDFGCAKVVRNNEVVLDVAGSPYYCAPEVLNEAVQRTGGIWKAADLWSIGVIIFLLVCGYPPFNGRDQEQIFRKIKKGKYKFPKEEETGIHLSDSVKDLINRLLVMKPESRLTAKQALDHPWITGEAAPDVLLPASVIEGLNDFRSKCRLKKAVGRILANRMTDDDKEQMKTLFRQFDKNGDGQLGPDEIATMMASLGKSNDEADELLAELDEDGDGTVSIDEFAAAQAAGRMASSAQEIKASFDMFDKDNDGFVTHKEIEEICSFLSPEATKQLIQEVDNNNDGKINFNEWLNAMQALKTKK